MSQRSPTRRARGKAKSIPSSREGVVLYPPQASPPLAFTNVGGTSPPVQGAVIYPGQPSASLFAIPNPLVTPFQGTSQISLGSPARRAVVLYPAQPTAATAAAAPANTSGVMSSNRTTTSSRQAAVIYPGQASAAFVGGASSGGSITPQGFMYQTQSSNPVQSSREPTRVKSGASPVRLPIRPAEPSLSVAEPPGNPPPASTAQVNCNAASVSAMQSISETPLQSAIPALQSQTGSITSDPPQFPASPQFPPAQQLFQVASPSQSPSRNLPQAPGLNPPALVASTYVPAYETKKAEEIQPRELSPSRTSAQVESLHEASIAEGDPETFPRCFSPQIPSHALSEESNIESKPDPSASSSQVLDVREDSHTLSTPQTIDNTQEARHVSSEAPQIQSIQPILTEDLAVSELKQLDAVHLLETFATDKDTSLSPLESGVYTDPSQVSMQCDPTVVEHAVVEPAPAFTSQYEAPLSLTGPNMSTSAAPTVSAGEQTDVLPPAQSTTAVDPLGSYVLHTGAQQDVTAVHMESQTASNERAAEVPSKLPMFSQRPMSPDGKPECTFCCMEINDGDKCPSNIFPEGCNHSDQFHRSCIITWIAKQQKDKNSVFCPLCMKELKPSTQPVPLFLPPNRASGPRQGNGQSTGRVAIDDEGDMMWYEAGLAISIEYEREVLRELEVARFGPLPGTTQRGDTRPERFRPERVEGFGESYLVWFWNWPKRNNWREKMKIYAILFVFAAVPSFIYLIVHLVKEDKF